MPSICKSMLSSKAHRQNNLQPMPCSPAFLAWPCKWLLAIPCKMKLHDPLVCILHVSVSPARLTPQSAACRRTTSRLQ